MKNFITALFDLRNSQFDFALVVLLLTAVGLACGGDGGSAAPTSEKKAIPAAYLGNWTGQDGSTVSIRNDNTGDYKSGSTTISGAAVEVDETAQELKFSFFGVESGKYKIDKAPANNQMTLDGMIYRRSGGFDSGAASAASGSADVPADGELQTLVKANLDDFAQAVQENDFSDFYANCSQSFQNQFTLEKVAQTFEQFAKNKINLTPKSTANLTFSPKAAINDKGILVANGTYQTAANKTAKFETKYLRENGEWKLLGLYVTP